MTTVELIQTLSAYPPDAEVWVAVSGDAFELRETALIQDGGFTTTVLYPGC